MTVKDLSNALSLTYLCGEEFADERNINGCYCGDLLSWVMSRAKQDNIWLTVMGNINSVGVAVLADLACIILTENASLDEDAKNKAEMNDVIILSTPETTYKIAARFSTLL